MTLQQLKHTFKTALSAIYPEEEISSFLQLLFEDRLNLSRTEAALQPEKPVDTIDLDYFMQVLHELKDERPIQYILQKTQFYGLEFAINEQVLIPRPETEELVDWILKELAKNNRTSAGLNLLDIGTGSGCIAIALAKHLPKASVYAVDLSTKALDLAKKNALSNEVDIEFIQADILTARQIDLSDQACVKFDLIVSNPPYVLENEKREIKPNVLNHEPHLALFVNHSNPLLFYDKIADFANQHLRENGYLFFEINQYLGQETLALLQQKKFEKTALRKDLFDNDRMILARK